VATHGIDVRQDAILAGDLDGADELLLGAPIGPLATLLVKLSQVVEVVGLRVRAYGWSATRWQSRSRTASSRVTQRWRNERRSRYRRWSSPWSAGAATLQCGSRWQGAQGTSSVLELASAAPERDPERRRTGGDAHLAETLALVLKLLPVDALALGVPLEILQAGWEKGRCVG
jgi:hypothetical protein